MVRTSPSPAERLAAGLGPGPVSRALLAQPTLAQGASVVVDAELTHRTLSRPHPSPAAALLAFGLPEQPLLAALPPGPGELLLTQRAGLDAIGLTAVVPQRTSLEALPLAALGDDPAPAHAAERLFARLHRDEADAIGLSASRPDGEAHLVLQFDHLSDDIPRLAAQLALAARLFGCSRRQIAWFQQVLPALAPRPGEWLTTRAWLSPRGLLPRLAVTVYDLPDHLGLQLARQVSLLEAGVLPALAELTAQLGRTDNQLERLTLVLRSEEPPEIELGWRYAVG